MASPVTAVLDPLNRLLIGDDGIVVDMHFVYILRCADESPYIGETEDITDRVEKHNAGTACPHTLSRRPVALVYTEEHLDRKAARQREKQLKRWTRAKKDALISRDLSLLKRL